MGKKLYSDEYIAEVAAGKASLPSDPAKAEYVARLARNYAPGITRRQQRGHPDTRYEASLSQVKKERGIPANATVAKPIKARLPVSQRKKVSLPYVSPIISKKDGSTTGKKINARSLSSFEKQFSKLPDSAGILLHVRDVRTGENIHAVGNGKGGTVNVGQLKKDIASRMSAGSTWEEAFNDAIYDSFDLYDDGSDPTDTLPATPTNFIGYVLY